MQVHAGQHPGSSELLARTAEIRATLFAEVRNCVAHIRREVVVVVTKGKLDFGPWEQIIYSEFDGNRPKRVLVKVIGE